MRIVNRATRQLYWAAYRQDDPSCAFALHGMFGTLDPGESVEKGMGQDSVKLRVGPNESGAHIYAGPFVNTTLVVISASEKPVDMDDDASRYSAIAQNASYQATRTNMESLNATSRAVAASVRSLINVIPSQLGPLKALASLVMMVLFDAQRPPSPPTLDDIRSAISQIVADASAQQQAAAIMSAWAWLDDWEAKVAGLRANGTAPTDVEVASFDNQLDDVLGPNSNADAAMRLLQSNADVRRSVIPTYFLGVGLFAKLRLLQISRTGLYRNLIAADYRALQEFLAASKAALDATRVQLDNDYIALLRRYDLGPCPEMITIAKGFNICAVGTDVGGDSPAACLRDQMVQVDFLEQNLAALIASTTQGR